MLCNMQSKAIVVPCYNECGRLPFNKFVEYSSKYNDILFLFVNDGSNDDTRNLIHKIKELSLGNIHVLSLPRNVGKAESVRKGINYIINEMSIEYVGFLDADLSTPLIEIGHMFEVISKNNYSMVIGSRIKRMGSNIERYFHRHYLGRIFATFASIILKINIYDTQCGAKIVKSDVASHIFKERFISKWLFDIEIIARTILLFGRKLAVRSIYEFPLTQWKHVSGSKLSFLSIVRAPIELLQIYLKYRKEL